MLQEKDGGLVAAGKQAGQLAGGSNCKHLYHLCMRHSCSLLLKFSF